MMRSLLAKKWRKKSQTIITSHDVLQPLKQVLLASRDVIIFSQIAARIRRGFFTWGDGCWLPNQL